VVEASARSGALNTAGHCFRLGRPVLAVPGPITSATSVGCHKLLRDERGPATVVTSTGKKQMRAMIASFGKMPNPHQNTSSTPITGIGSACEPTASG